MMNNPCIICGEEIPEGNCQLFIMSGDLSAGCHITCELELKRRVVKLPEGLLTSVERVMQEWGAEEDGIPDSFPDAWSVYKRVCKAINKPVTEKEADANIS